MCTCIFVCRSWYVFMYVHEDQNKIFSKKSEIVKCISISAWKNYDSSYIKIEYLLPNSIFISRFAIFLNSNILD